MKYSKWIALVALFGAALACRGGQAAPTETPRPQPSPTQRPAATMTASPAAEPTQAEPEPTARPTQGGGGIVAGEIAIVSAAAYVDLYDYYHVVGEIFNSTERPATDIELALTVTDGAGETVLKGDDDAPVDSVTFSPLLYTLAQGEKAPFDYFVSVDEGNPEEWEFSVEVAGFDSGEADRAPVQVENDQMVADSDGNLYIAGEVVNTGDQPALLNSFAGAALDANQAVAAAAYSFYVTRYLAAAGDADGLDRSPFIIVLYGPISASNYTVYLDADVSEPLEMPVRLEATNAYADAFENMHVVGTVTNEGDELLSVSLVAGLYAEDDTVVDASTASAPVYIGPGETLPINFEYFGSVNANPDELERVARYTIQYDAYFTYPVQTAVVTLETTNDETEQTGDGQWMFTGDVVNTSDQALSSATVVVALYDTADNLIATNWTYIYSETETIRPEDTNRFELTLYLDPGLDTSDFSFATFVQGYVQ